MRGGLVLRRGRKNRIDEETSPEVSSMPEEPLISAQVPDMKSAISREELHEWVESLKEVLDEAGPEAVKQILSSLLGFWSHQGYSRQFATNTAYINTIRRDHQPPYPG